MKLSNKLTLVRIIFAPIFFLIYFIPIWTGKFTFASLLIAFPLLIFAEFTDYLDGHFASKYNEVSDFGKLFDPFADVMLHITTFSCLMFNGAAGTAFMPPFIFILIIYREFSMLFVRMIATKKGIAIAARKGGKLKTVVYIASGFFALAVECAARLGLDVSSLLPLLKNISIALFALCLALSYISFADYLSHFGKVFRDEVNDTGSGN